MATVRLMPPADGLHPDITVSGRKYSCAAGATIDVPDFDAQVMQANGWVQSAGSVGVTTSRPSNPRKNDDFHDTTLGYTIRFDGKVWRNPNTGAAV